jgi:hypothetical protein
MAEIDILTLILNLLGAVIGGVLIVLIGPWVAEKFKLRESYIVPFRKWCTEFYGDLYEFKFRYVDKEIESFQEYSDIQVILDYRSLHNSLIDSYIWMGKMIKDNPRIKQPLSDIETVDKF